MGCCHSHEYGELFSEQAARRTARRFVRRGLRGSARFLTEAVVAAGVEGASVLEVGGGVGDLQAQLLQSGAARSTNVELSPSWEAPARELLAALDLRDRVTRQVGDFLDLAEGLRGADVVVLHRVLCCYPDWRELLGAALSKAERVLAFTVPVDRWWNRLAIRVGNRFLALRRRAFRAFVHPPASMVAMVEAAGFVVRARTAGVVWHTVVAERHQAG